MNICIVCKNEFTPAKFHPYQSCCNSVCRAKRKVNYRKKNTIKQQKYMKKYYKSHIEIWKNRQIVETKAMHKLKINGCAICGYNKCDRALHFHHVNPEDKKFQVTHSALTKNSLIDEINKCILLCANCHIEIEQLKWEI